MRLRRLREFMDMASDVYQPGDDATTLRAKIVTELEREYDGSRLANILALLDKLLPMILQIITIVKT